MTVSSFEVLQYQFYSVVYLERTYLGVFRDLELSKLSSLFPTNVLFWRFSLFHYHKSKHDTTITFILSIQFWNFWL